MFGCKDDNYIYRTVIINDPPIFNSPLLICDATRPGELDVHINSDHYPLILSIDPDIVDGLGLYEDLIHGPKAFRFDNVKAGMYSINVLDTQSRRTLTHCMVEVK
jgi:hypothetical protein